MKNAKITYATLDLIPYKGYFWIDFAVVYDNTGEVVWFEEGFPTIADALSNYSKIRNGISYIDRRGKIATLAH